MCRRPVFWCHTTPFIISRARGVRHGSLDVRFPPPRVRGRGDQSSTRYLISDALIIVLHGEKRDFSQRNPSSCRARKNTQKCLALQCFLNFLRLNNERRWVPWGAVRRSPWSSDDTGRTVVMLARSSFLRLLTRAALTKGVNSKFLGATGSGVPQLMAPEKVALARLSFAQSMALLSGNFKPIPNPFINLDTDS